MMFLKRDVILSTASSQVMRCHSCLCGDGSEPALSEVEGTHPGAKLRNLTGPFAPTRLIGYKTRSGEYTRSRYLATFAHKKPRVTGCAGSPLTLVARPSSTVIKTPQASGQSCGQAAWTTCFIASIIRGCRAFRKNQ